MSTTSRDRALTLLAFSRALTQKAVGDLPESKGLFRPAPSDNHAIWTLGHLALTYSWFKSVIDGTMYPLPDSFSKLFGTGSTPVTDAKAYPTLSEMRKHADAAYEAFINAAKELNDSELASACAVDTGGFCKDKLDAIDKASWHEGWHCGQLCGIRKALGLPSIFK